jgi:hypothetical protein
MSKMKNLYTEEQETAAEEAQDYYSPAEIRKRLNTGSYVGNGAVAHLLAALDEAEATRLEDMRRTTALLLNVIQAAQYWRERCQS